jgi:hypothetical protein
MTARLEALEQVGEHGRLDVRGAKQLEVLEDLARRATRDDLAAELEDVDAIGERADELHVVGRDHERHTVLAVQSIEQIDHLTARGGIEPLERFVEHEQLGVEREGTRERDLALLASREVVTHLVLEMRDAHALERVGDLLLDLGLGVAVVARAERDVIPDRGRDDLLVGVLQQHADALADLGELPRRIHAEDADLALLGCEQAQHVVQQRALAAAIGSEDDDALAALDHEVEPAQVHARLVGIGVTHARDVDDGARRMDVVRVRVRRRCRVCHQALIPQSAMLPISTATAVTATQ